MEPIQMYILSKSSADSIRKGNFRADKRVIDMSQEEIVAILRRYIQLLNESSLSIEKAFLYGSFASNQATQESDLYVLLVSKSFDKPGIEAKTLVWSLTRKIDTRIEPYSVGVAKFFSDEISPLFQIVKREGIEIV